MRCGSFHFQYRCAMQEGHFGDHRATGDDCTIYVWNAGGLVDKYDRDLGRPKSSTQQIPRFAMTRCQQYGAGNNRFFAQVVGFVPRRPSMGEQVAALELAAQMDCDFVCFPGQGPQQLQRCSECGFPTERESICGWCTDARRLSERESQHVHMNATRGLSAADISAMTQRAERMSVEMAKIAQALQGLTPTEPDTEFYQDEESFRGIDRSVAPSSLSGQSLGEEEKFCSNCGEPAHYGKCYEAHP